MASLSDIEHISSKDLEALKKAGVSSLEDLLSKGAQPDGRKSLATETGIDPKELLTYINKADLSRIKGIGVQFSDLLEEAGVDTVVELAARNAENLHNALVELNNKSNLVGRVPTLDAVTGFIDQAKKLGRGIFY